MKSVFALLILLTTVARAGVLERLSEASNSVWHPMSGCSKEYNEEAVRKDLTKAAECAASENGTNSSLTAQQTALKSIATKVGDQAEDRYFALHGAQQARELQCAADFADSVIAKSSEQAFGTVVHFVQRLRVARQQLVQTVKEMTSDPTSGARQCPLSLDDLQPDPGFSSEKPDRHFTHCQKILSARGAYTEIMAAIPLSDLPLVKKDLEHYANLPPGADADAADARLADHLREVYANAKGDLGKESRRLLETSAKGGANFDRTARYDLLADPRVTEKVLNDAGNTADMKALACRANARYGQGADSLDKTIFVGSMLVGFGTGVAVKVGAGVVKASNFAYVARASGLISLTGERVLQTGSVVLGAAGNAAAAYPSIIKACSTESGPKYSAKGNDEKCVSAPKVSEIEHDNCVLTKSLALLGFGGTAVAGYKLAKDVVKGAPASIVGASREAAGATNAERGAASEASETARAAKADELAAARRAPDVEIPSEHRPTTVIPDSGRKVDANEVKSGGYMPKSKADFEAHLESDKFKDGTMTMLVARDKEGKDHLLYAPRLAEDGQEGEINTHRTLRQKWRDLYGEDPQVVAAGECIVNMGGVIHSCVNQSGSYYANNHSTDYLVDVATSLGFKRDTQTKITRFTPDVELGHLTANEAVAMQKKVNETHPELLKEVRSFARTMYKEHPGEISGLEKSFAKKATLLGRKPDPEWPEDKKKAYAQIASMLPYLRENSLMALGKTLNSIDYNESQITALKKYLPDFYRDATVP